MEATASRMSGNSKMEERIKNMEMQLEIMRKAVKEIKEEVFRPRIKKDFSWCPTFPLVDVEGIKGLDALLKTEWQADVFRSLLITEMDLKSILQKIYNDDLRRKITINRKSDGGEDKEDMKRYKQTKLIQEVVALFDPKLNDENIFEIQYKYHLPKNKRPSVD